jgi:hypothetical protein
MATETSALNRALTALKRLAPPRKEAVRCEMCSQPLTDVHQHLFEVAPQRLLCVCDACAVLFPGMAADAKYRRVPRRSRYLADFRLDDAQWDGLLIPINMAFFFHSTPRGRPLALYPSPAGATESLLELESWDEVVAQNPVLATMEPDVEALLVNRIGPIAFGGPLSGGREAKYFLAPIDECFKLVGVIRANWRGLSGGTKVWEEIDAFFVDILSRSQIHHEPEQQSPTKCPS